MNKLTITTLCLIAFLISGCGGAKRTASPTQAEFEAAWRTVSEPGPAHRALDPLNGKWNLETRFWKEPGAEPEITHGISTVQWIFEDRFLRENYLGDLDAYSFNGLGIMGYDNLKKQYFVFWIDSMNTGSALSYGTYNEAAKSFEFTGTESDPFTKEEHRTRSVITILDRNTHRVELYSDKSGRFEKSLEVTYSRSE